MLSLPRCSAANRIVRLALCVLLSNSASASTTDPPTVRVAWDANTEPDLAGYRVYVGVNSRDYLFSVDVGKTTRHVLTGLAPGIRYFSAVTAVNLSGLESGYSAEIEFIGPIPDLPVIDPLDETKSQDPQDTEDRPVLDPQLPPELGEGSERPEFEVEPIVANGDPTIDIVQVQGERYTTLCFQVDLGPNGAVQIERTNNPTDPNGWRPASDFVLLSEVPQNTAGMVEYTVRSGISLANAPREFYRLRYLSLEFPTGQDEPGTLVPLAPDAQKPAFHRSATKPDPLPNLFSELLKLLMP